MGARQRRDTTMFEFWSNGGQTPYEKPDNSMIECENTAHSRTKRDNEKKIASTSDEIADIHKCPETISDDKALKFLKSIHEKYGGDNMRSLRKKPRKTYLMKECCGAQDGCSPNEIFETHLTEECCHEGCMVEEIVEDCGIWRNDDSLKKETKKWILSNTVVNKKQIGNNGK